MNISCFQKVLSYQKIVFRNATHTAVIVKSFLAKYAVPVSEHPSHSSPVPVTIYVLEGEGSIQRNKVGYSRRCEGKSDLEYERACRK